jgi:hypothetical protein
MSVLRIQFKRLFKALDRKSLLALHGVRISKGIMSLPESGEFRYDLLENEDGIVPIAASSDLAANIDKMFFPWDDEMDRVILTNTA